MAIALFTVTLSQFTYTRARPGHVGLPRPSPHLESGGRPQRDVAEDGCG